VTLDGAAPVEVDLYGSFAFKQRVWSSGTIAEGTHTLRIDYTGTKNAASSGYTIGVDAFDVVGSLGADTGAPTTVSTIDGAWHKGSVTVTLTASDANSFVTDTFYRIGEGVTTTYTAPFAISARAPPRCRSGPATRRATSSRRRPPRSTSITPHRAPPTTHRARG